MENLWRYAPADRAIRKATALGHEFNGWEEHGASTFMAHCQRCWRSIAIRFHEHGDNFITGLALSEACYKAAKPELPF